jgi:hypothetical protein
MSSVMIFVKRNGLLVACPSERTQDGAEWYCPHCESIVIRASFGVMNGTLICRCGSQVELVVDGIPVDPEKLNVLPGTPRSFVTQPKETPRRGRTRRKKLTDEDFLRECGIATEGEKENA